MNNAFGKRLLARTGRTFVVGLLGCFLFLSVSGPIALLGLACGTSNFAPTSKSDSEGNDANELEELARATGIRRSSRLIVGGRQTESTFGKKMQGAASSGLSPTRVRQMPPACEHDRRNGFGAPLRC